MDEENGKAERINPTNGVRFGEGIPVILLIVTVVVSNILSRSILSPLLVRVEHDFSVSHGPAAQLFLFVSIGYSLALLCSGFISSKITHRGTILVSSMLMSAALAVMAAAPTMNVMRAGVFLMGAGSGLYPPSGIVAITDFIDSRDWQKALSLHEVGPHLGMVLAPWYANVMLNYTGWRGTVGFLAGIVLLVGFLFFLCNKAGKSKGEAPTFKVLLPLFKERNFWILMLFFGLGLAGIQGIYLLTPTFLVSEAGFSLKSANNVFGISRFLPILALLSAGLVMDRIGVRRTVMITICGAGLTIFLMGVLQGPALVVVVFLQPTIGALYFPAGLAVLAKVGPPRSRNVAVSMLLPLSAVLGTGIIPSFLGYMGDVAGFTLGFLIVGGVTMAAGLLSVFLRT